MTDQRSKNDLKTIRCGISHAFDEKTLKPGFTEKAFGDSFKPVEIDLRTLAAHILDGGAWIPGQFKGSTRKNETFICTALIALDYDEHVSVRDLLAVSFVRQHAAIIYPTASSTSECYKTRVVFILDSAIHGVEATRTLIHAIADHIGLPYDPASYKPAQLFYGSRNAIEIPHINQFAVLPLALAAGLTADLAQADYDNHLKAQERAKTHKPVDPTSSRAEKYAAATYDGILREANALTVGNHANDGLFHYGKQLFAIAHWPGISESKIESDLEPIYSAWPNVRKSAGTVASARRWGRANPRELVLEDKPAKQSPPNPGWEAKPAPAPAIAADLVLNERYVSERLADLPTSGVIAIISGTGTGKTELSQRAVQEHESALTVTPLRMLTRNASERNGDEYYENVTGAHTRSLIKRLSITLKSLEQFATLPADQFPRYDLLRLDELSKMLEQLGSELFKDGQAARTFSVLKQLIKNAKRVYVTDAYMGEIEIQFLKSIRPDVFTVLNTYQHNYGRMVIYPTYEPELGVIEKAIAANKGTVAIQSNRQSEVERLTEYFGAIVGRDKVMSIHSGNSTNLLQRTFLTTVTKSNTADERTAAAAALAHYRVVIASPSILTGVDIQPAVYRLFGVFYSQHGDQIDAAGCMQMLARYRNPQETHVWVGQGERKLATSAQTIYNDYREAAHGTAILCSLSPDGLDFDGINQELLKLQAALIARRNRSLNALYADFVSMARHNYTVQGLETDLPKGNTNGVIEASEAVKARLKADTLNPALEPMTPEMHRDKSQRGIRTDQDNAAVLKYWIERTYRQPITEQLYDKYDDGNGAAEIKTYIDVLHTPEKELKARDTRQLEDGTPYTALKHRTARARTIRRLYLAVWGNRKNFSPDHTLTLEHIETVVSAFVTESARDLALYCGKRVDHSDKPVNILKLVMRTMGIKLRKDRQPTIEGAAATYRLEAESSDLMAALAKIRMAAIEQDEIDRKGENRNIRFYGENLQKSVVYREKPQIFVKTEPTQQPDPAPISDWRPPVNSTGASRSNPFSKAVA